MELLIALGLASWLGYRWWSSSKTAAATKQDSFTRAQYEAAVRDLVKQPDFVAVLSSGGAVPDMVLTPILEAMTTQSLALWDSGTTVERAAMAIEVYGETKHVDLKFPDAPASTGASLTVPTYPDLGALSNAVKKLVVAPNTAAHYSAKTTQIGLNLAMMLRYRAISDAKSAEESKLATSTIDDAFKRIDLVSPG